MITDKKLETLEHSSAKLTITIDKDVAKKEYQDLLKKYAKTAQIKGFRRGKVPANLLEQKFGEGIKSEVSFTLIENGLKEVFESEEKKPLSYEPPELLEEVNIDFDADFVFSVKYDVFPEVTLGKYKGFEIEEPSVSIAAADLERELGAIQDQNSVVMDKTEGDVQNEDIVTIDYVEINEDGGEIDGTARSDYVFTVGTGYNTYKIDDELLGTKKNEDKIIEKEYPEDFESSDLAGRKVTLKIKVTQIKEKQLPELDDELAQDVSDKYKTLDDLKKDIRKNLRQAAATNIRQRNIETVLDKIVDNSKIDLPESMVQAELKASWNNFSSRSGLEEAQLFRVLEQQGKTKDDLYEEWRPSAERSICSRLLLNEIIEKETIEVSDTDIEEELKKNAEKSNMTPEQVRENVEKNNMMDYLESQIRDTKAYDFLLKNVTTTKGKKVKFLDLIQNNQ